MTNARDKANIPVLNFQSKGIDDNATSTALTINSNETVEITSSEQELLYLNSSHATNCKIKLQGGYHSNLFSQITESAGAFVMDVDPNGQEAGSNFRVKIGGSEKARLNSTGLGIGNSNPSTSIHISSNTPILTFEETDQSNRQFQIGSFGNSYAINDATNSQFRYILDNSGNHVFNEGSQDCDFRVESNNNANMLFVDGGQDRIGIGNGNPQNKLDISATTWDDGLTIKNTGNFNVGIIGDANRSGAGGGILNLASKWNGTEVAGILFQAGSDTTNKDDGEIVFRTASAGTPTERMRIDSGGRLLVGTSSAPGDTDEVVIVGQATANGKAGMSVKAPTNHAAGNGTAIVAFDFLGNNYYSTSGKWGIYYRFLAENDAGSYADRGRMHFLPGYDGNSTTSGNGFLFRFNGNFTSDADDVADLGSSSNRWDDVYATNGTIQTSDQNEKQSIQSLTTAEMNVGKKLSSLIKTFKWNSSVEEKGDSARTHTGIIAQDVKQAFTDEGLDVANYALFISNTWWENSEGDIKEEATDGYTEKNRLGVRYSELLSFIQAYNDQRLTELEARITTLEANNP